MKSRPEQGTGQEARRRLWVVTELFYPEVTSTGYYLTRTAEGLAGTFEVQALCGQPNYLARGVRAPRRERHRDVEIHRVRGTTLDKNVILFKLINMVTLSVSMFVRALRHFRRGDLVLVVTTPPSLPFFTAVASLARGAGYTLLIHDNYPEILVAANKAKEGSTLVRFLDYCNRWLYRYASSIIVVGRDMRELVGRKTAGLDIPVFTIPNWAELEQVAPAPRDENPLLRELGVADRLVFLYAGNMGYPNDIESITECAARLRDDGRFHFVFLGTGVKRPWLAARIAACSLTNVTLLDPRPRSEQSVFLNACDVALVSLVSKMRGVSMPSRTYNILAAGKPILALTEPGSELDRVVAEDRVGWSVPPEDPDRLLETILLVYESRHLLGAMGDNARRSAVAKYSFEEAVGKYAAAMTGGSPGDVENRS
jgi:colanic acid biosynthesis glycosyl transferase WcaI